MSENNGAVEVDINPSPVDIEIEYVGEPSPDMVSQPLTDSPLDGVAELQRQLDAEKAARKLAEENASRSSQTAQEESRRRQEAERVAGENYRLANASTAEARAREYESINNALLAETSSMKVLRDQFVKFQTDGEFEKAADVQEKMARTAARLESLESGKASLDEAKKSTPATPAPAAVATESPNDFNSRPWNSAEAENVMRGVTPQTAAWMRNNPRYFSDPAFRQQVQGADGIMRGKGVRPDTEEYFKGVENLVGLRAEETITTPVQAQEAAVSSSARTTTTRTSTPAAPPSRSVPNNNGQAPNTTKVSLTPAQREMAKMMFSDAKDDQGRKIDPDVAYARHWDALRREGKLKDGGIVL